MNQPLVQFTKRVQLKHADIQNNRAARRGLHPLATADLSMDDHMFRVLDSYRRWPEESRRHPSSLTGS